MQVGSRPLVFGDQRISRLPNTVMGKRIAALQTEDQSRAHGLHQHSVNFLLGLSDDHSYCGGLGTVPEAGETFHDLQCAGWKAAKPARHKNRHVISYAL